jgi:putative tryptophan/tyrosine transport system substrate-binding protein
VKQFWICDFGFWIGRSRGRIISSTLGALFFALCSLVEAQPQSKIPKIGWLGARSFSNSGSRQGSGAELFVIELNKLGYIDGKSVTIEYRYADDKFDRLPALADQPVHIKVDVLMAAATVEALAAKNATQRIPIIFFNVPDPVASGLVDSLARPGRNITGFTSISAILAGKRLELLKEMIPNLPRVAVLWNPQNSASTEQWKESQRASRELGLRLHSMEVSSVEQFDRAFEAAIKARSAALIVTQETVLASNRNRIVDLASKHRLAAIYTQSNSVETGGLMSYGPNRTETYRRGASMADKILKGAKPAELPVEQPSKFEFIINLKAAKQIGLTIPPSVLARADKVIR